MKAKNILGVLMVATIGGLTSIGIQKAIEKQYDDNTTFTQTPNSHSIPVSYANYFSSTPVNGPDFRDAAAKTIDAVVHIKTEYQRKNSTYDYFYGQSDPLYDFFKGNSWGSRQAPIIGYGSGVIISDDGYIVTNNHVVQDANKVEVTLNNKKTYFAKVLGTDPTTDLALIKVEDKNMPYISIANSDSVKIGEWVLAVGNPFNLTSTVTAGIVSAKARNINILGGGSAIESFIQTDAAVNKGNSGGALVNTYGELIGVNAAIASTTGSYSGYSFAIPSNIMKKVVDDLMVYGEVQRAFLGIQFVEVNSEIASQMKTDNLDGVYVVSVLEKGAAKEADIKPNDIITEINGQIINHSAELLEIVGRHRPGDIVSLKIKRDDKEVYKKLTLKNRIGTTDLIKHKQKTAIESLGAAFEELSTIEMNKYGLKAGIKVASVNAGKFRQQGIREGFIILAINNKNVKTVNQLKELLSNVKGGILIEGIYPNGMKAYYGFGL